MEKKRLVMDIDPVIHKKIKMAALRLDVSMTQWVINLLLRELQKEQLKDYEIQK